MLSLELNEDRNTLNIKGSVFQIYRFLFNPFGPMGNFMRTQVLFGFLSSTNAIIRLEKTTKQDIIKKIRVNTAH